QSGVVAASLTKLDIAGSATEIHDVEVRPLVPGVPVKVGCIDIKDANFTQLLHDFRIHPRPFVRWDIHEVHVADLRGNASPLGLAGELTGKTSDFTVYDHPVED